MSEPQAHEPPHDPIICTCECVRQSHVEKALADGHRDFRSLRQKLSVAGDCGNCHRLIMKLLRTYYPRPLARQTTNTKRHFPMPWRHFSPAKLTQEYSPSSCVDNMSTYIGAYIVQSQQAKQSHTVEENVNYGAAETLGMDYFAGEAGAPLVVYLHGGYWQELSKNESCFMASKVVAKGYHFLVVDYTLAPKASIETMVDQCCMAIAWAISYGKSMKWHFDPNEVILTGSSAGAHLAASVLQRAANESNNLHKKTFVSAILFSGIYDLRPIVSTYINQPLGLTLDAAEALSPGLHSNQHLPPSSLVWGANETSEFKRQSQQYAEFLQSDGVLVSTWEAPNHNHFDVVDLLGDLLEAHSFNA